MNFNKNENKKVNVFFASDERYLPYLAVAIYSLSEHASEEYDYDIKILSEGFSADSFVDLRKVIKPNVKITVFDVRQKISDVRAQLKIRLRDYYSESIYYRMFIPSMFEDIDRAVYLDSDIVLLDDVAKLYFSDLGDNLLGAVTDESVITVPIFCDYVKRQIGLDSADEYFNSGVLLMNLAGMRDEKVEQTFVKLLRKYNFNTVAPDQDYLNFLCRGRVCYLSAGWNKHAIEGRETCVPREDLHLLHYNMFNKPWHYDNVPFGDEFWNLAQRTPFAEVISEGKRSYTDEQRAGDLAAAGILLNTAKEIYESGDSMNETAANEVFKRPAEV